MTYQEFLDSLLSGINLFLNNFGNVIDSLLSNYIFITFLGISIFISFLYWFLRHVIFAPLKVKDNIDYWVDTKRNYKLYNDVKYNYMFTNELDVNLYKYRNLLLSKRVQMDYLATHEDYESFLKQVNLKLGRQVALSSLAINRDLEYDLKYKTYELQQLVRKDFSKNISSDNKTFEKWNEKLKNKTTNESDISESQDIIDNF